MDDIPYRIRILPIGRYGSICDVRYCGVYHQTSVYVQVYDYYAGQWSTPLVYCSNHLQEVQVWIKQITERLVDSH